MIEAEVKAHFEKLVSDLSNEIKTLRGQLEVESQLREEAQRHKATIEETAEARCAQLEAEMEGLRRRRNFLAQNDNHHTVLRENSIEFIL